MKEAKAEIIFFCKSSWIAARSILLQTLKGAFQ